MDMQMKNICRGCLSYERKMVPINDISIKLCFSQLCSEVQNLRIEGGNVMLCWECAALVSRFAKFKSQVTEAHWTLETNLLQNTPPPQHLSTLQNNRLFNISITPTKYESNTLDFTYEVIKQEINSDVTIKEELENVIINESDIINSDSDDDNKLLIDFSNEKKGNDRNKTINGHKKKRKKKNHDLKDTVEALKERTIVKKKRNNREDEFYKEIELRKDEIDDERRDLSLQEDYVNAMFRCERCVVSFPNADDLNDHVSAKHELNASYYKCKICECTFLTEVSYNYHTNKHIKRYQCIVCTERHLSKRAVIKHYEIVHCHGTNANYEDMNEKPQKNGGIVETQHSNVDGTKLVPLSFPCEFCTKTFKWKTSLRKHVETHRIETGQKRKPYCEPCKLSFTTTSNLQKHVKTSSKHQIQLKLRKLETSNALEKQASEIEQIKESVARRKQQYGCGQCGKHFQWRGNLLRHLNSHAARAKGELICEPCGRTFSSIATYKQHMQASRKHVSENDFKYMCSECGKKFANKTRLQDHVDWEHLKNYVHKCTVCQKVFKSHTSLYLHKQVVHKKDNAQHLCDHCGKPFPNRAKLRSHIIAMHTAESPYKCPVCSARFSWHSCLSRHVRRVHRHHKPVGITK